MKPIEFLTMFYCLQEDTTPRIFGALSELTVADHSEYGKPAGVSVLELLPKNSFLLPFVRFILRKDANPQTVMLELLLSDHDLVEEYLDCLHERVVL